MPVYTQGPLQISDFLAVWESITDPAFAQGFVSAGEGAGLEAYTQGMAQLARVSSAINTTTQALYILPFSGQTGIPASGPSQATVALTFTRTKRLQESLILGAGLVWYDEVEPEYAVGQGTTIDTGRRFTLQQDLVFQPGQAGPLTGIAVAERPGYGYNNPQPGSINLTEQPGTQYSNINAVLAGTNPGLAPNSTLQVSLAAANVAEVLLPQHVGQYISLTAPTPAAYRIVAYTGPNGVNGGSVQLEQSVSFAATTFAGIFQPGEILTVKSGATVVAYLTLKAVAVAGGTETVTAILRSAASYAAPLAPGYTAAGQSSGATLTIASLLGDPVPTVTTPVSWAILDWVNDWGLSVTNAQQPTGGTSAMLDELGYERGLPRITGEVDGIYRQRIAVPADTVSPNAIKRMLNRTLTKNNDLSWCFREVGQPLLPGFFYDWDAYDYDAVLFTLLTSFAGNFIDGEQVVQHLPNGQVAQGHALVTYTVPSTPFVSGQAGTTGRPGTGYLFGVANVNPQPGGAFQTGIVVTGLRSGATFTPTCIAGTGRVNPPGLPSGSTAFRVYLDYLRFRAYFMVDVEPSDAGEFGFFWGGAASGVGAGFDWWDDAPFLTFYDGHALGAARAYLTAYHSVDAIRAGGVTFEFEPQLLPCTA